MKPLQRLENFYKVQGSLLLFQGFFFFTTEGNETEKMNRAVEWNSDVNGTPVELGQTFVVLLLGGDAKSEEKSSSLSAAWKVNKKCLAKATNKQTDLRCFADVMQTFWVGSR